LVGWSVVCRYTNATVAVVLALHWLITWAIEWRKGEHPRIKKEILPVILGVGLPVLTLGLYNYFVFGSPFDNGYHYTRFDTSFAYQYFGQVTHYGDLTPLQIIINNLRKMPLAFLTGFPLLVIGFPAFCVVLYHKLAGFFHRKNVSGTWSSLRKEIPWDILLVLIGWFMGVFLLYLMYTWTAKADYMGPGGSLISFDRFYLPGLFPIAVICALIIVRFPCMLYIPFTVLLVGFGSLVYVQWAWELNILPNWFSNGFRGGSPPNRNYSPGFPQGDNPKW
jgi:hypothetical protein